MDSDRRQIYAAHGVKGLKKSEAYQEENLFELDPWEACERFFEAEDPDDREYFLLNGNAQLSDEESEDDEDEEAAAAAALAAKEAAATKKVKKGQEDGGEKKGLLGGFPMPPLGLGAAGASAVMGVVGKERDAARSVVGGDPWLSLNRKLTKQQQLDLEKTGGDEEDEEEDERASPKDYKAKAYSVVDSPSTKLVPGSQLSARLAEFKTGLQLQEQGSSSEEGEFIKMSSEEREFIKMRYNLGPFARPRNESPYL